MARITFARQVTDRGARFMPRRQELDQTMGADKSRAPVTKTRVILQLSNVHLLLTAVPICPLPADSQSEFSRPRKEVKPSTY